MAFRKEADQYVKVQRNAAFFTSSDADWWDDIGVEGARSVLIDIDVYSQAAQTASTTNFFDIFLRHSDDGSNYSLVPVEEISAVSAPGAAGRIVRDQAGYTAGQTKGWTLAYKGDRKFLRIGYTENGTVNSKRVSARVITGDLHVVK